MEAQLVEIQLKSDEQARQIQELTSWKSRAMNENADLTRFISYELETFLDKKVCEFFVEIKKC